jgi:REP element-mobilizing transposase RayT
MANTYTSLNYHLVFSTKNRAKFISSQIEQRLWEYMGGIVRSHKMTALQISGTADHIHALILAPASLSPSQIAQYLKGDSSRWIHQEFTGLRMFEWQDGYGAFTVSKSRLHDVMNYTFKTRLSITRKRASRKSIWNCSKNMELGTTKCIYGVDSTVATRRILLPISQPGLERPG